MNSINKKPPDRKSPVAPPVYRPQPLPKALQAKSALALGPQSGQSPRHPVAPPVYRPEAKKIVQAKAISPQRQSLTPSGYHPEQKRIAQPKMATAGSRSAKRPPSAPFSVRAVRSRFGGAVQCALNLVQQPQIVPSRETLIQAAKDLSLLAETVKDAIAKSPRGVDTRALSRGLQYAWDLGRAAQENVRWNEDLNPQLPQVYADFLALYNNHKRAVKAFYESEEGLKELIEQSNQRSFASNPLIPGLKFYG